MDLNLLPILDALLQENSITLAAERLGTSPASVSRALGRLRRALGDPLLVRAGQQMVPTPRAIELREEVRALLEHAGTVLAPAPGLPDLDRTFTLQVGDLLLGLFAGRLSERVRAEAPQADLVFLPEAIEGTPALRQSAVDVELGVLNHPDPEILTEPLAAVPLVAVARAGHPLFDGPADVRAFAAADHVGISRKGRRRGPIDAALERQGLNRRVAVVVPSHTAALFMARTTDLVCLTLDGWLPDAITALGLRTFPIPVPTPPVEIGMAWHPRHSADRGHQWLRDHIRETVRAHAPQPGK
ncbi:LysR family transcriptional regulator [Actinomadura sp. NAK00032]|uniref:LysR family transcriptional regulator n=1 Tax=Actinomadura sp. NAK00032 TaxID=2742128 RepID=UPI0015928E4C|nr:LysR family transcriptional regulator [Actinomadura sp. NAK00032]QKW38903.1 LysR family transcriptional regulator [Actinomadura sp. NAK00032]